MAGRKRSYPLLTQERFNALVSLAQGFSAEQCLVARRVMVDGMTLEGAGADLGWSRQRVYGSVRRLERIDAAALHAAALVAQWRDPPARRRVEKRNPRPTK